MLRLSAALAAGGLALLLWSFVPAPSTGSTTAPATTSPAAPAHGAVGQALFTAKGCATCHLNRRAAVAPGDCCGGVGPDLSTYTNDPAFLRRWLTNPAAVKPGTQMPNLNLAPTEIEALIAFLNAPR
jgi:cytochrome c1